MKLGTIKNLFLFGMLLAPGIVLSQSAETRKLSSFTELQVDGSFETLLQQGNDESVKIEAKGVDPKKIITEVNGKKLRIYLERGEYHNIRVKVYVTYQALSDIEKSGSGKLECKSDISATGLRLASSGSGKLSFDGGIKAKQLDILISGSGGAELASLEADDLNLTISGSGGVSLASGNVKNQEIHVSGSGNVRAFGVKSERSNVSISGSGNANITVNGSLGGKIVGSGNINYKGDAVIKNNTAIGSGRIRKS